MPGIPELLVILLIVFLIFGAGKLPAIGDALGRSIKNFKRAVKPEEIDVEETPQVSADDPAELDGASATEDPAELEAAKADRGES